MVEVWNKSDLVSKEKLEEKLLQAQSENQQIPIIPISAKNKKNISLLLNDIDQRLMKVHNLIWVELRFNESMAPEIFQWLNEHATSKNYRVRIFGNENIEDNNSFITPTSKHILYFSKTQTVGDYVVIAPVPSFKLHYLRDKFIIFDEQEL
eukprot:c5937_g1_i1.p1 GENE.c5937_g1_i1~~c5937_g1_i1.p1  ORF type:complete len:151 (-),score=42.84 c5937_g1_i1:28-480(-)